MLYVKNSNIVRWIMNRQLGAFFTHQFSYCCGVGCIKAPYTMTAYFVFPNFARMQSTIREQLLLQLLF